MSKKQEADARSAEATELIRNSYAAIRKIQDSLADTDKIDREIAAHRAEIARRHKLVTELEELLILGPDRILALRDDIARAQAVLQRATETRRQELQAELDAILAEMVTLK